MIAFSKNLKLKNIVFLLILTLALTIQVSFSQTIERKRDVFKVFFKKMFRKAAGKSDSNQVIDYDMDKDERDTSIEAQKAMKAIEEQSAALTKPYLKSKASVEAELNELNEIKSSVSFVSEAMSQSQRDLQKLNEEVDKEQIDPLEAQKSYCEVQAWESKSSVMKFLALYKKARGQVGSLIRKMDALKAKMQSLKKPKIFAKEEEKEEYSHTFETYTLQLEEMQIRLDVHKTSLEVSMDMIPLVRRTCDGIVNNCGLHKDYCNETRSDWNSIKSHEKDENLETKKELKKLDNEMKNLTHSQSVKDTQQNTFKEKTLGEPRNSDSTSLSPKSNNGK